MKLRGSRKLAASFVISLAALPACGGAQEPRGNPPPPEPHPNPPGPDPTVIANPPPIDTTAPPPSALPTASTTAPPPQPTAIAGNLPPAPAGGHLSRNKDGTCWHMPDVHCPPQPATCNPPPPTQVACPPK